MSEKETISSEEYCRSVGIKPIPATEGERITAILEHQISRGQTRRPPMTAYLPWMALGIVCGLAAFQVLEPWMPLVGA